MQAKLEAVLGELLKHAGTRGAALVSRDGLTVKVAGRQEMNRETFSAMTATLVGAAEIALSEVDAGKPRHVMARTSSVTLVLVGATIDLLLVVIADAEADTVALCERAEKAAAHVANIVG